MDANLNALVDGFQDIFEAQVLISALKDGDFYHKFQNIICVDSEDKSHRSDFSNPVDNVIYRALTTFRKATGETAEVPGHQDLAGILFVLASQGEITDIDRDMAIARAHELLAASSMSPSLIASTVPYWVRKTRAQKLIVRASTGSLQAEELLNKLQRDKESIDNHTGDKTRFSFKEAFNESQKSDVDRYPIGIPAVDKALGGGLAKREFTLVAIPSGGGKTVLACNLVAQFANLNLKGVFITTEQPPSELVPRFISAGCHVPFETIKDGVKMAKLNQKQQEEVLRFSDRLESNVVLVNWGQSDHDAATEIPTEIESARKKLGSVDYVILDWIGGSLGAEFKSNMDKQRLVFKRTADSLDTHAKNENVIAVGFAQTTPALSKNKKRIDRGMLGECKTMHERATNLLGISAMQEDEKDDSERPSYTALQWCNLDKSRKSVGGCVKIKRDFAYQRFTAWGRDA